MENEHIPHYHYNEEALEAAIEALPEALHLPARKFITLLQDESVTEVNLNGHQVVKTRRAGKRSSDTELGFINRSSYLAFVNEFLLHLSNTKSRISEVREDKQFIAEGFMSIPESPNSLVPMFMPIHIVGPPVQAEVMVTIAKKGNV